MLILTLECFACWCVAFQLSMPNLYLLNWSFLVDGIFLCVKLVGLSKIPWLCQWLVYSILQHHHKKSVFGSLQNSSVFSVYFENIYGTNSKYSPWRISLEVPSFLDVVHMQVSDVNLQGLTSAFQMGRDIYHIILPFSSNLSRILLSPLSSGTRSLKGFLLSGVEIKLDYKVTFFPPIWN